MSSVKIENILYTINKRNKTTIIKLILSKSINISINKEYFKINLITNPQINNITDIKVKKNVITLYTDINYQKINNFEQILFSYMENNGNKLFDTEYSNFPISNKIISPYINIIDMSNPFKYGNIIILNEIKEKTYKK
jgi:hypothetical protein